MLSRLLRPIRLALSRQALLNDVKNQSTASSASFTLDSDMFKLYMTESGPSCEVEISREEMIKMYTQMSQIKEMESKARELYQQKIIRGFLHLCNGQEACCVGMESALMPGDEVITAYRCHGWTFTRGIQIKNIIAELAGKKTGCAQGKGGSMHMYAPHYYGGNGIVGAQVPVGAGIAFTNLYNQTGKICVTLYGDGAANQGQVFEAFNMAALWKLPCLFVCENNKYGMGTSADRSSACTDYYTRGQYIPGVWVEGQNVLAIKSATQWAADWVRAGNGPLVMELFTYRYHGHSMSDPGKSYRSADEVKGIRQERDPHKIAEMYALEGNLISPEEIKEIKTKAKQEAEEAAEFALSSLVPPTSDLFEHIVAEQNEVIRGSDPFTSSVNPPS